MAEDILQGLLGLPERRKCDVDDEAWMLWFRRLADADQAVIVEFLRQLAKAEKPEYGLQLCPQDNAYLASAVLGFDLDRSRSREIAKAFLLPALRTPQPLTSSLPNEMLASRRLHLDAESARLLFDAQLRRLEEHRDTATTTFYPLARQLDPPAARAFASRLLPYVGYRGLPSTLAVLAPHLAPDEIEGVARGIVGAWLGAESLSALNSLPVRLTPSQAEALLSEKMDLLGRSAFAPSFLGDDERMFRSWRELIDALTEKLGPVERTRSGQRALDLLRLARGSARQTALALTLGRLLVHSTREQLVPILRQVLERLPEEHPFLLVMFEDKVPELLELADPRDVSSAAHGMLGRLLADSAKGHVILAKPFGAWAPVLSSSDAYEISMSLVREIARSPRDRVVAALSPPLPELSRRLSSEQSLAVAQILVKHLSFRPPGEVVAGDFARERLRFAVRVLARRLVPTDLHALLVGVRSRVAKEKDGPTLAWLGDVLEWLSHPTAELATDRDPEQEQAGEEARAGAETLDGVAAPAAGDDSSRYVETVVRAIPKAENPKKRALLFQEFVRVASGWRKPLPTPLYHRPVPVQQLYVDLLKEFYVVGEEWERLVRALQEVSGQPTDGDLWRYVTWTRESASGRALRLDWGGRPPWR